MENPAKRARTSLFPMIPMDKATQLVKDQAGLLPIISREIDKCRGYILAQDIRSNENVPPFDASIMDGYAVIASDGCGEFEMIAPITAGLSQNNIFLTPGKICRITTGAPIPTGADAVVMVEDTDLVSTLAGGNEERVIRIKKAVKSGENIRPKGSDVAIGEKILEKGVEIGPSEIGILASVGIKEIFVYSKPIVSVLSTGEEVVEYAQTPGASQIRDSNRPTIINALQAENSAVLDLGIASDNMEDLETQVRKGLEGSHILITSGGVSMGESDLLKPVLTAIGAQIHFGRVFMKPGKPATFATVENVNTGEKKLIFSLPGNPVSSIVCFYLFVVPALRKMSGCPFPDLPVIKAKLSKSVKLDPRPEYQRAFIQIDNTSAPYTQFVALDTGKQMSSRLLSMRTANALIKLPPDSERDSLQEGELVDAILIGNLRDFP